MQAETGLSLYVHQIKNSALTNEKGVDPAAFTTVLESSRQVSDVAIARSYSS